MSLRDAARARVGPERWRRLGRLGRRVARPAFTAPYRRGPISAQWGFDRGLPVDRWYIERFLDEHRADIRGAVLEVKSSDYTDRFGSGVERREVLDIDAANPHATVVTDLAAADDVAADQFDCFLLTQTLQFVFDVRGAAGHAHRLLKPGGVLLATLPGLSRIQPRYGLDTDYWRFTPAGCERLFEEAFGPGAVDVRPLGNVRTATAYLNGVAVEEVARRHLRDDDPYHPVVLAVRARKGGA